MTNTQPLMTKDDAQELKTMIQAVGNDVLEIKLSNARREHYFSRIEQIDETVNGKNGKGGPGTLTDHETRISSLESNRRWLIGVITAVLISVIGLSIAIFLGR